MKKKDDNNKKIFLLFCVVFVAAYLFFVVYDIIFLRSYLLINNLSRKTWDTRTTSDISIEETLNVVLEMKFNFHALTFLLPSSQHSALAPKVYCI